LKYNINIKNLFFILFPLPLNWVKIIISYLIYFSSIHAGDVSLSISEDLINQYLKIVGDYNTIPKKNKPEWSIQNPHVKLKNNEALFLAKVIYKQGLINIRKDIKLNLKVKYDLKKNELFLIFDNSIINMERRGVLLNSIDIKGFYEPKLIFNGPNLKNKYFKTRFNPKRKVHIKPNFAEIFIENKTIDLILNLSFIEN
tara:strand:+ start:4466 stop:5062 length:597 start_codon:yes stop_codon:yes gene_type:complete